MNKKWVKSIVLGLIILLVSLVIISVSRSEGLDLSDGFMMGMSNDGSVLELCEG